MRAVLDSPEEAFSIFLEIALILEPFSLFGTTPAASEITTQSEKNLSRHRLLSMDSHCHIKAPLQTKLQTGQVILPSPPVPAPARGKDSSHHAPEFIFNPGPSDNRKRGRMKNLITGTSTEVTWLPTPRVGAASLLLRAQIQAEISPVSSGQAATPSSSQKLPHTCHTCPFCSAAGALAFPEPRV